MTRKKKYGCKAIRNWKTGGTGAQTAILDFHSSNLEQVKMMTRSKHECGGGLLKCRLGKLIKIKD